ncbi:histone H3.2 [Trifolium repens]|nr:histone H3.2 [Trifolium repens]
MNCTKISIFKQTNKIGFSSFLKSGNSATLKSQICFEILSDFSNQSLEWKFPYEKLCALLVLSDLTKSHCSWTEPVWLLHSSGRRSRFPSGFGCELFPWSFSSGGLASGLFGTCHFDRKENREKV